MHHTYTDEYEGYNISALCINRSGGWEVDCNIHKENGEPFGIPTKRLGQDRPYRDEETAKIEGLKWCRSIIDKLAQSNT